MTATIKRELQNEEATLAFGRQLAALIDEACVIYLHGELGAGKTTLVRGVLQGMGHHGHVKSPTYTLVERYDFAGLSVFHFDLYRLSDAEELEFLGIRDYLNQNAALFVEWPEKGAGFLVAADIDISLCYHNNARLLECKASSAKGRKYLQALTN